jgi:hypothetical protein
LNIVDFKKTLTAKAQRAQRKTKELISHRYTLREKERS